jgi:TolB-like protein/tetratricopeptide (TPR) repeat protein
MAKDGDDENARGSTPSVFISYASLDSAVAETVCEALEKTGVRCWIAPRDVSPGAFYGDEIVRAIDATKATVLILSQYAATSPHVLREVERAASKRHAVIPLRIDKAPIPAGLEYFLNTSQWLDASSGGTVRALPKLVSAVQVAIQAPTVTATGVLTAHAPAAAGSARLRKRMAFIVASVISLALVGFAAARLWLSSHRDAATALTAPVASAPVPLIEAPAIPEKSVAVLPFVDMSERKDQEYFSDGLTEELIDMLTKVPELRVPARTSSFYFKGKQATVPDIARALGVADVLEGSVRKSGNHLRITTQLIRADNGYHLWSETYDRKLDDIFKVQDEIAGAVVKALKVSLLEGQTPRATPTTNTEAYTLYLQGRSFWQRHSAADNKRAADCLRHALELDRMFAPAWAVLAVVIQDDFVIYSTSSYQKARAEAYPAAEQALKLDPRLSDAHLAMAQILHDLDFDFEGARAEINQALALDSGNSAAFRVAADIALTEGRLEEARQLAQQAVNRDPLSIGNYRALGDAALLSGRLTEAEAAWRKALELNAAAEGIHYRLGVMLVLRAEPTAALAEMERNPDEPWRVAGLPLALDSLGRRSEADRALAVAVQKLAVNGPYQIAVIYAHRNNLDRAFDWLDRAYQERDGALALYVKGDPMLDNLRRDPRYKALLRKMKLPE